VVVGRIQFLIDFWPKTARIPLPCWPLQHDFFHQYMQAEKAIEREYYKMEVTVFNDNNESDIPSLLPYYLP
jgi:hypothetical protein